MTGGESAEHGDVIRLQQLMEHGLDALVGKLGAAVGELTEDDALAAVDHAAIDGDVAAVAVLTAADARTVFTSMSLYLAIIDGQCSSMRLKDLTIP